MEVKKNRFFIFIFSLFPGAGQMYMGALGKGAIIMTAFCFWACFANDCNIFLLFGPVIWFYAFMDTHYLKRLSAEEIKKSNDGFVKRVNAIISGNDATKPSYKKLGYFIVFIGILYFLMEILGSYADYKISRIILGLFITFIIILLGIRIIKRHSQAVSEIPSPKDNPSSMDNSRDSCHNESDGGEDCSCENHINELVSVAIEDKFCPRCGIKVLDGDKFCFECGKSLVPQRAQEIICSCGHKLSAEAKFCPNCGKKRDEDNSEGVIS